MSANHPTLGPFLDFRAKTNTGAPRAVPFDPIAHDLQAIHSATNALMDYALRASPSEALTLVADLITLREKLNAVIERAHDQADGFFTGGQ